MPPMFRPQLQTNTPTRGGLLRQVLLRGVDLFLGHGAPGGRQDPGGRPRGGAAFHDRLGDVLGAVEGAAGVNPVPERGGGRKAAGLHKVVGAERDIQLLGQGHGIRGNHHAHGEDDHVKDFVLDLAGFE